MTLGATEFLRRFFLHVLLRPHTADHANNQVKPTVTMSDPADQAVRLPQVSIHRLGHQPSA
jgi:hypothetical protein